MKTRRIQIGEPQIGEVCSSDCFVCRESITSAQWVVEVPVGISTPEDMEKATSGNEFEARTVVVHYRCATGRDIPPDHDPDVRLRNLILLHDEVRLYAYFQDLSPEGKVAEAHKAQMSVSQYETFLRGKVEGLADRLHILNEELAEQVKGQGGRW